jgi:hypothetical protein
MHVSPKSNYLQALHALGLADTNLCMPSKDAAQFVRALAPYLKVHTPW